MSGRSTQRITLFRSPLALVENLRCHSVQRTGNAAGFSPEFQICLPYRGLFVWHVGDHDVVSDANQVLFVSSNQPYRLSEPVAGGYAELIITPALELLSEIVGIPATALARHEPFRRHSRRADLRLQFLRARFLHRADSGHCDDLTAEELIIEMLRCALDADASIAEPSLSTRRLIGRAKEYVAEHLADTFRLEEVARAAGASPAYLTDVFRRFEGLPLHRYALRLRLARALVELSHANDLTELALDLGFSSHSHFTSAFRRAFGCTPSQFRETTRTTPQRWIA
jgi:AraC family transcriptional regulator